MITPFSYPTSVLFLDDNQSFLGSIRLYLDDIRKYLPKYFNNINDFRRHYEQRTVNKLEQNIRVNFNETGYQTGNVSVDFYQFFQHYYLSAKEQEISVVIIDYDLGYELNGLDVIEKYITKSTYSLLLTGKATSQEVIKAFNNNSISAYINKSDDALAETIKSKINQGIEAYFNKVNEIPIAILKESCPTSLIFDQDFVDIFQNIIKTHSIVEYYMFETIGSFVMYDHRGKKYLLHCTNDIINSVALEDAISQEASNIIIDLLKKLDQQLCYFDELDIMLPPADMWLSYIKPATIVNNKFKYSFENY